MEIAELRSNTYQVISFEAEETIFDKHVNIANV